MIESEAHLSVESRSDVAPNARRCAQADANLGQGLFIYIYIFIYLFIYLYIYFDERTEHNNGADVT